MADSLSTSQTSGPASPSNLVPHISTPGDELHPSPPTVPYTGTDCVEEPTTPFQRPRTVDKLQGSTPGSAKASAQQILAVQGIEGEALKAWRKKLSKEMKDIMVQMPISDLLRRYVRGKEPTAEIKAKLAEITLNKDNFTVQERHMYNDLVSGEMSSVSFFIADVWSSVCSYKPSQISVQRAAHWSSSLWRRIRARIQTPALAAMAA